MVGYNDLEQVVFQQYDYLGASYRASEEDGTVLDGFNADGAPAEMDPTGGNVGASTPYLVTGLPGPDEGCSGCMINTEASPMYVNGMQLRANLNGFPIEVEIGFNMLETGSGIPAELERFQRLGYRSENHGLGIFTYYRTGGWEETGVGVYDDPDDPNDEPVNQGGEREVSRTWRNGRRISVFVAVGIRQTQTVYTNKSGAIRKAIVDADTILRADNDCSKFFGKYGLAALRALDGLLVTGYVSGPSDVRTGIRMGSPAGYSPPITLGDKRIVDGSSVQDPAYRTFHEGIVNLSGPFLNMLSPSKIGGYNPNSRESRVLQILHELAHMILVPGGSGNDVPLIPDDAGSGQGDSATNTEKILEKCKTEIENLKKDKKKK